MEKSPILCEVCGKELSGYALLAVYGEEAVKSWREGTPPSSEDSHFYCLNRIGESSCYMAALKERGDCTSDTVTVEIKFKKKART